MEKPHLLRFTLAVVLNLAIKMLLSTLFKDTVKSGYQKVLSGLNRKKKQNYGL